MTLAYQEYYTLEDYQNWEGNWELIEGMPYAMAPSPSVTHQTVSLNAATQIKSYINEKNADCSACHVLMETDWQISNHTIVRPDVMVVCQKLDEKVIVTPELIIEVVSLSSTKRDELMKLEIYQREGVMYYILVYPEKHLAKIYHNKESGFKKLGDFSSGKMEFVIGECSFSINFDAVWR